MTVGVDLSSAVAELARLDSSRLMYGQDYSVDLQATRSQAERSGQRLGPLITSVNPKIFQRPTFRLFLSLLDNYKRATGTAETFGPVELREQSDFLDACMATPCMQYAHQWLTSRQLIGADPQQFKAALTQMWFSLYRREVANDSSGFEHVFLGESDRGQVKGLHSWIQYHLEERNGHLEYRGYLHPHAGPKASAEDRVISVHFRWLGETKAVSSVIMGSTPEFEMALYTMCFLGGGEENLVWLDDFQLKVKAYRIRSNKGDKIGTCYPELMSKGGGGGGSGSGYAAPHHQGGYQQQQGGGYTHQQQGGYAHQQPGGYAPQQGSYAQQHQGGQQAWGGAGQHRPPQQHQQQHQQAPYQQQGQQQQNQTNPNDTTSQGCINLVAAILGIFCSGNKNKN